MNPEVTDEDRLKWLRGRVAAYTGLSAARVNPDIEIDEVGLDSVGMVGLLADLEKVTGQRLDPEWLLSFASLRAVAAGMREFE